VEFLFQVGPRRFQVRRNPEQVLMKKGKEQKILHKVELCAVDADGTITGRYSKVGDVARKVEEIIGFTTDQFRQVVLLPQGEFRKLLLASSTDKEKILEKLFATERFKRIETMLRERRDAICKSLEGLRNTMKGILEGQEVATPEELAAKGEELQVRYRDLEKQAFVAAERMQQTTEAYQQGHVVAGKFTRLDLARTRAAALETDRPAMTVLTARVERGERALALHDLMAALVRDRTQRTELAGKIARLDDELLRMRGALATAHAERDGFNLRAGEIPVRTAEQASLAQRLKLLGEVTECTKALQQAEQLRSDDATAQERLQADVIRNEEELVALGGRIESLVASSGRKSELEQRLREADTLDAARKKMVESDQAVGRLTALRDDLAAACATAEVRLTQAVVGHDDLSRRLVHGQAARLAHELTDGTPCPVCGSLEHPIPATGGEVVPTEAELDVARLAVEQSRGQLDRARELLAAHDVTAGENRAALDTLRQQLGGHADTPPESLRLERETLKQLLAQAVEDERLLATNRTRRDELGHQLETAKTKLAAAGVALQEAASQENLFRGQVQAREAELGDGERDQEVIRRKRTAIEQFITETTTGLATAEAEVTKLEREVSIRQGQREETERAAQELASRLQADEAVCAERLCQSGFAGEDEYRAAGMATEELEHSRKRLREYQEQVAASTAELTQSEAACAGLAPPDLVGLTAARTDAETQVKALATEQGAVKSRCDSVRQAITAIDAYRQESDRQEQQLKIVGNLANQASGANPKRITLQRYVLASLFEEVALAASARLSRMSRGRYHLRRSTTVDDARRGAGLDLEVTDDFTGFHRPASTLSGGETFLASLSLALGLSDVVLAQSGGRYLDTLFIDEGFGTLDPETLDIAMDTLVRLNEQGRMVGIISHVAELKEQIPRRLEVLAGRSGSRVRCEV
jgi:exonuclease SbcC